MLQHMGQFYHCGCLNDQYLSPYQTRAKWLPCLLRKSRPFIFGPIYYNIWGIFTILGVLMIITYHHTKPEPIGCLGCLEKAGPLYFNIGPCGPSMEKPSILKFAVLRKRALKLLHLPFPVFLNLGNDKHL